MNSVKQNENTVQSEYSVRFNKKEDKETVKETKEDKDSKKQVSFAKDEKDENDKSENPMSAAEKSLAFITEEATYFDKEIRKFVYKNPLATMATALTIGYGIHWILNRSRSKKL